MDPATISEHIDLKQWLFIAVLSFSDNENMDRNYFKPAQGKKAVFFLSSEENKRKKEKKILWEVWSQN